MEFEMNTIKTGQVVEGEVVSVTDSEVLVDIRTFTEGLIYLNELTLKNVDSCHDIVSEGDIIKAMVKKIDEEEILLSRKILDEREMVDELYKHYRNKDRLTGKVVKEVKSGLIVRINGIDCYMHNKEADLDTDFDPVSLMNQEVTVRIVDFNKRKNRTRIKVSRTIVIKEDNFKAKQAAFNALEVGGLYEGIVDRVEKYGALVVANDFRGLVPNNELSHLPFKKTEDVINEGDTVNVKVIDKDENRMRATYSVKALLPKPWDIANNELNEGDVIKGKVVRITDFGAFVNVLPLVDGLLHKNEVSYNPNVEFKDVLEEGQEIEVKVLNIDRNRERLSLSLRALKDNPWETTDLKPGKIVDVTVTDITDVGAEVLYTEDIVGFLHKNQISAEKRVHRVEDELTVGDQVQVKVTRFNPRDRNLQVSIRRIKEDAERKEYENFMKKQESEQQNVTVGDLFGDKLKDLIKKD
ncbi:S1 RNA-binding domain-containing protein [Haloplasma contractile]|uniref:30S ribosomal protein S1 n=1 Tax=Haloplasma contractile SSD-17B TaxID=1033810 RepID=F7PW40_9MOLU|nr:S1 RNA-binding domain-containing protein [Haloplasma contractile]ERJ12801.1 30S ribosomal protein S1 [Haloplasma contractile SSD-17B]